MFILISVKVKKIYTKTFDSFGEAQESMLEDVGRYSGNTKPYIGMKDRWVEVNADNAWSNLALDDLIWKIVEIREEKTESVICPFLKQKCRNANCEMYDIDTGMCYIRLINSDLQDVRDRISEIEENLL